jgi:hypothetical protein
MMKQASVSSTDQGGGKRRRFCGYAKALQRRYGEPRKRKRLRF